MIGPSAGISGAYSTVVRQLDGRLIGSNTDGSGFVWSIRDEGIDPAGLDVVILGAGGAARAVAVSSALAGAKRVTVTNRTAPHRDELVGILDAKTDVQAVALPWKGTLAVPPCDVLVDCAPVGMGAGTAAEAHVDVDLSRLASDRVVCDLNPETAEAAIARSTAWACSHGKGSPASRPGRASTPRFGGRQDSGPTSRRYLHPSKQECRLRRVHTPCPTVQSRQMLPHRRIADAELVGGSRDGAGSDVRPQHLELAPCRPLLRHHPAFCRSTVHSFGRLVTFSSTNRGRNRRWAKLALPLSPRPLADIPSLSGRAAPNPCAMAASVRWSRASRKPFTSIRSKSASASIFRP